MYLERWGLAESPFRDVPDPARYYPGAAHEEALARIQFLIEGRRRLGVLSGEWGAGKSLVLMLAARQAARAGFPIAGINVLGRTPDELLWELAAAWGLAPEASATPATLWRTIDDELYAARPQNLHYVLLLDDADAAAEETLSAITRLLHSGRAQQPPLTVILAVQRESITRLGRRLTDLAELHIGLTPWELEETQQYLSQAIMRPAGQPSVFDLEATSRVHELSGGVPRLVNHIADLALTAAAGQERDRVTAAMVNAAYEELSVEATTPVLQR